MRYLLYPLLKLHLKGGAVYVDGMGVGGKRKRRNTNSIGSIFYKWGRKGCPVELCNSPIDAEINPLILEGLEILKNVALLKDGMRKMVDAECGSHVALVYQSWARLQIQALYKRLDEIKEIEQEAIL